MMMILRPRRYLNVCQIINSHAGGRLCTGSGRKLHCMQRVSVAQKRNVEYVWRGGHRCRRARLTALSRPVLVAAAVEPQRALYRPARRLVPILDRLSPRPRSRSPRICGAGPYASSHGKPGSCTASGGQPAVGIRSLCRMLG
eukprot:334007-Pyramimonas_sp.AAC.1